MAWIEVHQSLRNHRKVLALADRLDMQEPHVAGHLIYLWLWALDNAPDGKLPDSPRFIARASEWVGDAQEWVNALVEVGMLDREADGWYIHDFWQYVEKLINRRESNKERQAAWRARHKTNDDGSNSDVTVISPSHNGATVPNRTQPNQTKPSFAPHPVELVKDVAMAAATAAPSRQPKAKAEQPESKPHKPDLYWDTLVEHLGYSPSLAERGAWNKAIMQIKAMQGLPEDIPKRCGIYRARWPAVELTASALAKHWTKLIAPDIAQPKKPEVDYDHADLERQYAEFAKEVSNPARANGHQLPA